jgi:sugar (pentulose or hexulose) kinase
VVTVDTDEVTCRGAAMLAAVGAGVYANVEEAAGRMVRVAKRYRPHPAAVRDYEEAYATYRRINRELLPTFGGHR